MNKRNFRNENSRKTEIEIKIDSNYDSKIKSKVIGRYIRMKQDPQSKIALKLFQLFTGFKALHQNSESAIVDVQASISSSSLNEISLSSTSWMQK